MKRIRFLADTYWLKLVVWMTIFVSFFIFDTEFGIWSDLEDYRNGTNEDGLIIVGICVCGYSAWIITILVASRSRVVMVEVNQEGVRFCSPFRRAVTKPWRDFPDLYHGSYCYDTMHHFIVLTNRRLKPEQLLNINHVLNDENTIKIEYNRKRHQALLDVLPP